MKKFCFLLTITILISSLIGCTESFAITTEISPANSGTVTFNPSSVKYKRDSVVNLTASPASNMVFDNWSGDVIDTNSSVYMTMDSNKIIIANFKRLYSLNINIKPSDAGSVSISKDTFKEGEEATITANPKSGFQFAGWSGDVQSSSQTVEFVMDSNKTVTANFKPLYKLNVDVTPSGAGSVSPSDGTYDSGRQVTLSATPASGYKFDYWSGDVTYTTTQSVTVSIVSDKTIVAHFSKIIYNLNLSVNGEGTTNPSIGIHSYEPREIITITAIPAIDWKFDNWSGDVTDSNSSVYMTMDSNKTVIANFIPTYSIKVEKLMWYRGKSSITIDGFYSATSTYVCIEGTAKNVSKNNLNSVICVMKCWDGDTLISSAEQIIGTSYPQFGILSYTVIGPNRTFNFEIRANDDPRIDNITIEFKDSSSNQILHK